MVTLLFTDIEGSTRLLHALGDEYPRALADQRRLLRGALRDRGGVEVDTQGDAFFYAFPDASSALLAAADAQRAVAAHAWPRGLELRVRMGLHSGMPTRTEEGYVGLALHEGARVMSAGHGGQVIVSSATAALVATQDLDGLSLRDLGEHRLKDLLGPQQLYQLSGPGLREEFPPLKTLAGHFTNLPADLDPLIGREAELAELTELLADEGARIVTLTGPGGQGKTRLALASASGLLPAFPGGVFAVQLAPLADQGLIPHAIAAALGLREVPGEPLEHTLTAFLAGRRLLLVLDNFEHLLAGAGLVTRLLAACPGVRVLVTSRAPLRVRGERELALAALSLEDAVSLFAERARAVGATVDAERDRTVVTAICERVDRLALAIELAAARARLLTLPDLHERLGQSLALLTQGARDAPERQRTLRATLDWSWQLLTPAEQTGLARLSAFAGGATLEQAEAIAEADLDVVSSLAEHSLLRIEHDREARVLLLETIREYAGEQLDALGETGATRRRHADWFLGFVERAEHGLAGEEQPFWLDRAETELDNLRAAMSSALETGAGELALRIATGLKGYWESRSPGEGPRWLRVALDQGAQIEPHLRLKAVWAASQLSTLRGDDHAAERWTRELLALADEVGAGGYRMLALANLAVIGRDREDQEVSARALADARAALATPSEPWMLAEAETLVGTASVLEGEHENARGLLESALERYRTLGNRQRTALIVNNLGYLALGAGDLAEADRRLSESIRLATGLRDELLLGLTLGNLGLLALLEEDYQRARQLFVDELEHLQAHVHPVLLTEPVLGLAAVAANSGDPEIAARLLASLDEHYGCDGWPWERIHAESYERTLRDLERTLDPGALARVREEGRRLAPADAVAVAQATGSADPGNDHPADPLRRAHESLNGERGAVARARR